MNANKPKQEAANYFAPAVGARRFCGRVWSFKIALAVLAFVGLQALPVLAQTPTPSPTPTVSPNPCPPGLMPGNALIPVPVIASGDGLLKGTIILSAENQWMASRLPESAPTNSSKSQCQPQFVRMFREFGAASKTDSVSTGPYARIDPKTKAPVQYPLPRPGPTFRARVGDLVQLTFINQINVLDFPYTVDRGENIRGCDSSSAGYPGSDQFPDCFHGSSTGNIHFHGTHTNPNTTADNVFIEVRPSLRDKSGKPLVTAQSVAGSFDKFFAKCEVELNRNVLKEWPRTWADLPDDWTDEQKKLLKAYDDDQSDPKKYGPAFRKLWPINEAQIKAGAWPQYYIGAFPYCFRLPEYTASTWPPPPIPMHMGGAGMAEMNVDDDSPGRQLMMGQSPGTHWYHAHKHGSTAINVANGMTGAFIIEGKYDDELNNWYGTNWTQGAQVLVINQLGVSPNLMRASKPGGGPGPGSQDKGPDFSINGQLKPVITMQPGQVQMWRIVNTSGRAGAFFVGPPGGFQWKQLAQDGVQFDDTNYKKSGNKSFLLAAGNRADLLVKAPLTPCATAGGCKYDVLVQNEVDPSDLLTAKKITLVTVNVMGPVVDQTSNQGNFIPTAPTQPPFLADIKDSEVTGTKNIMFASGNPGGLPNPAQHTIDGKKFDGEVGEVVLLNHVEEWKISNATVGISHPFHIHINPFQVTEVFDPNELVDPKAKAPLPKYVFIDPSKPNPPTLLPGQCALNPYDESTWRAMTWMPGRRASRGFPAKPARCAPTPVPEKNIWWDVFPIPSGQTTTFPVLDKDGKPVIDPKTGKPTLVAVPGFFKMRSRFVDYPGFYVIHCHILAHEDRGMMTIVEVAPMRTPYSHH